MASTWALDSTIAMKRFRTSAVGMGSSVVVKELGSGPDAAAQFFDRRHPGVVLVALLPELLQLGFVGQDAVDGLVRLLRQVIRRLQARLLDPVVGVLGVGIALAPMALQSRDDFDGGQRLRGG